MKIVKNISIGLITIIILSSFFSSIFGESHSTKRKIAFQIGRDLSNKFNKKYGMRFIGVSEAAREGKYINLGLEFTYPYILSKDQGRNLLLACMDEALQAYNSCPTFRPFMANYPFTSENIHIKFFIQPPKNWDVYYPNIGIFSFYNNKLRYKTDTPHTAKTLDSFLEERETYEEALKIVAEQQKLDPNFRFK